MTTKMIKQKSQEGNLLKIVFQGEQVDQSLVNSLRRTLIGEVNTWSLLGEFTIYSNTSCFNDEYLMNRVQMTPIYLKDPKDTSIFDQDLVFYISEENEPTKPLINKRDLDLIITTHMFQIYQKDGNRSTLDVKELIPYDLPIIKLRKGQEFHLSVSPGNGIGRIHASWKSCIATYKWENPVSLGITKPKGFNPITGTANETLEDKKNYPKDKLNNPQFISLVLKSNGHNEVSDSFLMAVDSLEEKLLNFRLLIDEGAKSSHTDETVTNIEIIPSTDIENYLRIKITDPNRSLQPLATHTIGNLLANHLYYRLHKLVNGDIDKIRESMCSYHPPHPLDEIIYLHIKTPDGLYKNNDQHPSLRLLDDTIDDLLQYLRQIRQEFTNK